MKLRSPKNTERFEWTEHAKQKMKFYALSANRLKRILRNPERIEQGVAPHTVAVMQSNKSKKRPEEIWLMYRAIRSKGLTRKDIRGPKIEIEKQKVRIISAWRYPGKSPPGPPPIPDDIIKELNL
jgi:hypothetical protein